MVPTLVDNLKKRVIVDSLNIMNYIDQVLIHIFTNNGFKEVPDPPLYPESCRALAKKHAKLVDATPHAGKDGIRRMKTRFSRFALWWRSGQ